MDDYVTKRDFEEFKQEIKEEFKRHTGILLEEFQKNIGFVIDQQQDTRKDVAVLTQDVKEIRAELIVHRDNTEVHTAQVSVIADNNSTFGGNILLNMSDFSLAF